MNVRHAVILVLLVLAFVSWKYRNPEQQNTATSEEEPLSDGYYMIGTQISNTDDNGNHRYALEAQRIDHRPSDDSIHFTDLQVTYIQSQQAQWKIVAQRGSMGASKQILDLRGDVKIIGAPLQQNKDTTVSTEHLILELKNNIAKTQEAVAIEIAGGQLEAVGMHADFTEQSIDLLSQVRGKFKL